MYRHLLFLECNIKCQMFFPPQAFAASAAINWLLKDGVSRIVRMAVSTSFGQTFDADLKVRMHSVTCAVELGETRERPCSGSRF